MRTSASNSTVEPSSLAAVTFTVLGVRPSLSSVTPEIEKVSVPSRPSESADSLGLDGTETFSISGVTELNEGRTPKTVKVTAAKEDGSTVEFDADVRIDTPGEADYYRNGGILQYVLRQMASK